jgi:hypothetical protein
MLAGLAALTLAFTLYSYRRVSAQWD